MPLDADAAYLALCARDARFDGRLFVGVTSTGIYCRPVCRVRTPKRENCRFFESRAQAEAAAFRPCLKCRPEIAPGLSSMDSSAALADTAARWIGHAVHRGEAAPLPAIAARLGVTDRHFRRIFHRQHGVTPRDFVATHRLLLAKQLLTDTTLPVTEVALASGYASLRRFNAAFAQQYRLNPTQLRRQAAGPATPPAGRTAAPDRNPPARLRLAYRPPYDVEAVLAFHARRRLEDVEEVTTDTIRRTLAWPHRGRVLRGWIACRFLPARNEVHVDAAASLAPVLGAVLQHVRDALDLDADPAAVDIVLQRLPVPVRPGTRLPSGLGSSDGFETAARAVLAQGSGAAAAQASAQRLVARFGSAMATPYPALQRLFPDAATVAAASLEDLAAVGITRDGAATLQALARAVAEGHLVLRRGEPVNATVAALRALSGMAEATAQGIAMRSLAWPDAWPAADVDLMNALGTRDPRTSTALAEAWRPWRGYAAMRLWHHLETPA